MNTVIIKKLLILLCEDVVLKFRDIMTLTKLGVITNKNMKSEY